jgi:signal peptidase I
MRLNLSDEPITAELLAESLARTGTAVIAVEGTSMHPTLQMGWRIFLKPARGEDLRVGDIAVFRGDRYLIVHRLVWKERAPSGTTLVFRGDYNRLRERIAPAAVLARVAAVEVPGPKKGAGRVVALEADALTLFYRLAFGVHSMLRPLLPAATQGATPGPFGRAARAVFAGLERVFSLLLPSRH